VPKLWCVVRRTGYVAVLALVAGALFAAPAMPGAAQQRQLTSVQSLEAALLVEVNALRRRHGLAPVRVNPRLAAAASSHSRAMATRGFFAHNSADGAPFWRRVERFYGSANYRYWSVGENLLWASPELDAQEAMRMWIASPLHRKNLLEPRWREIGFSAVHADFAPGAFGGHAVVVVTANFGVRR
jgi:uncharacterized protein YkwD